MPVRLTIVSRSRTIRRPKTSVPRGGAGEVAVQDGLRCEEKRVAADGNESGCAGIVGSRSDERSVPENIPLLAGCHRAESVAVRLHDERVVDGMFRRQDAEEIDADVLERRKRQVPGDVRVVRAGDEVVGVVPGGPVAAERPDIPFLSADDVQKEPDVVARGAFVHRHERS
jgi:hypothetical protein